MPIRVRGPFDYNIGLNDLCLLCNEICTVVNELPIIVSKEG